MSDRIMMYQEEVDELIDNLKRAEADIKRLIEMHKETAVLYVACQSDKAEMKRRLDEISNFVDSFDLDKEDERVQKILERVRNIVEGEQ